MYKHAATKTLEAWVDSGASYCTFDAVLCRPLGIKLTDGVGAILGRSGFFENFKVVFDAEANPPQVELTKIHRT
jgi:hypothetical protein